MLPLAAKEVFRLRNVGAALDGAVGHVELTPDGTAAVASFLADTSETSLPPTRRAGPVDSSTTLIPAKQDRLRGGAEELPQRRRAWRFGVW
ncbi:hypothetical protein GCM10010425_77570 [Streptomyces spororaveus]|uniref:Uncharacterized protein n=1 Tax=Streptomyces spororaveus TaxID=284039 RepID=A0ABQ3TQB3_9ACTN|nr:hypothetical protein Sspor_81750 [Streptomyces spororaveus]